MNGNQRERVAGLLLTLINTAGDLKSGIASGRIDGPEVLSEVDEAYAEFARGLYEVAKL